jgi:hypothetical protein
MTVRLAKDDAAAMAATIEATGFKNSLEDIKCLAFSPASSEANKAIHAQTNERLLAVLLSNSAGQCIHITGEMRALADPFHRRLCAEIAKRSKTRFTILYDIPDEYSGSPEGVGKWNAQRWGSKNWSEKLSAMNLIGEAFVDVRAFNTLHEIQYSVFGNRFIQLQEKHSDEGSSIKSSAKRVWLLDSEKLNGFLTTRALDMVGKSKDVPEALFKRFFAKVSGVTAQTILAKLIKIGPSHIDAILDKDFLTFDPNAADTLDIFSSLDFVQTNAESRKSITLSGRQFVEALG